MNTILVVNNNFEGAYGSINLFVQEIVYALKKMNQKVFWVNSISEAVELYENETIDFSIGIGKYLFYLGEKPLYDLYERMHYQWIIDNPLKIEIDTNSKNIKYILIDKLFASCISNARNPFLYLPLGIPNLRTENVLKKEYGIVFSGQIRNSNKIFEEISLNDKKQEMIKIIDKLTSDLDILYIPEMMERTEKISMSDRKVIFSLTNSFIRAYKREKVLNSIKDIPVIIIGDNSSEIVSKNKNILLLGNASYYDSFKLMSKYMYSLNVEPNFNTGFHDRILRAAANGNVVITNQGDIQQEMFDDDAVFYNYSNINMIEDKIKRLQKKEAVEMGSRLAEKVFSYFVWEKILDIIICDFGGITRNANNRLFRVLGNKTL